MYTKFIRAKSLKITATMLNKWKVEGHALCLRYPSRSVCTKTPTLSLPEDCCESPESLHRPNWSNGLRQSNVLPKLMHSFSPPMLCVDAPLFYNPSIASFAQCKNLCTHHMEFCRPQHFLIPQWQDPSHLWGCPEDWEVAWVPHEFWEESEHSELLQRVPSRTVDSSWPQGEGRQGYRSSLISYSYGW